MKHCEEGVKHCEEGASHLPRPVLEVLGGLVADLVGGVAPDDLVELERGLELRDQVLHRVDRRRQRRARHRQLRLDLALDLLLHRAQPVFGRLGADAARLVEALRLAVGAHPRRAEGLPRFRVLEVVREDGGVELVERPAPVAAAPAARTRRLEELLARPQVLVVEEHLWGGGGPQ